MRPLIYIDDVLQSEGTIELRTILRPDPGGQDEEPDIEVLDDGEVVDHVAGRLVAVNVMIVNERPCSLVGGMVVDTRRNTMICRFKTIS